MLYKIDTKRDAYAYCMHVYTFLGIKKTRNKQRKTHTKKPDPLAYCLANMYKRFKYLI